MRAWASVRAGATPCPISVRRAARSSSANATAYFVRITALPPRVFIDAARHSVAGQGTSLNSTVMDH